MGCFLPRDLYGVIGWPLGQSLSPLVHNTGFQILDIPSIYMAWPLRPDFLEDFIKDMRILNIMGCSVTIPHKIAILRYADNISEAASLAGAINTLSLRENALFGENTDVTGFLSPLEDIDLDHIDALILGAGGAAHAVAAGLKLRGCRYARVTSPGNKRQYKLTERFGFTPVKWEERYEKSAALVINATPLGMTGKDIALSPYDFSLAPQVKNGIAYDLVYNPLETVFLKEAGKAGRICISGLEMFYGQANAQFKLWTGENLPKASYEALEKALIPAR